MRGEGFPTADIAVGFLRDIKLRRLAQHRPLKDIAATQLLYLAVVLSSWAEGYRIPVEEADSPTLATADRVAALKAVALLDDEGKIPVHVWESWFKVAWERREKKRVGGQLGSQRRWHPDRLTVSPAQWDTHSVTQSDSAYPSGPSNPTGPVRPSVVPVANHDRVPVSTTTTDDGRTCPGCGDLVEEGPNVAVVSRRGGLGHIECPALVEVMA